MAGVSEKDDEEDDEEELIGREKVDGMDWDGRTERSASKHEKELKNTGTQKMNDEGFK
jgi:hypothetical protein